MATNRIELAQLTHEDNQLLALLFKVKNETQVFQKDMPYQFKHYDTLTNRRINYSITLSHDIIRRASNSSPSEFRYEVVDHKRLGEGGFSEVFGILCTLALQNNKIIAKRNKQRVVKVQHYNEDELTALIDEVELTEKAKNMHIKQPALTKLNDNKYLGYLVMRRLNGSDLYSVITQLYCGALDLTTYQRLTIIIKLLSQLKKLHANGIIHRDLKPDNIMIDLNTGELDIYDYGLSKVDTTNDVGIDILGTPGYIPPEIYLGAGTNDKSDVFSMSVVIAMLWYADEPGNEPEDVFNYQFNNIFSDEKIDLNEMEKSQILTLLRQMSDPKRDNRISVQNALNHFTEIRECYVNRKIDEMIANKPARYLLENGLFSNNKIVPPKRESESHIHSCRF